ncbi:MAG TPA: hypothetical protein VKA70_06850 [Blastocatellia bacterium]|nr:hypothetical protein [Blastocatellia bacterium]
MIAALGHAHAAEGRVEEARRVLEELKRISGERYVSPYHIATIFAGLGDNDRAFACLDQAHEDRSEWLIWLAVDPKLDPLRDDPRFQVLLRRVGL